MEGLASIASATVSGELVQLIELMGAHNTGTAPNAAGLPLEFVEWVRYELWTGAGSEPADVNHTVQDRGVGRLLPAVPGVNVGNQQAADRRIWQILVQGMADTGPLAPTGAPLLPQPPAVDATRASFNFLARQRGVDRLGLAIVGHDYGAMYGMVVAETDERVAAAVFLAADARWANWFDQFWLGLEGEAEAQYFAMYAGLDPVDNVGRLGERQLFQWAANDFFVPAAIRDQFAAAAPASPVLTYDRVDHSLDLNTAEADRVSFLADQLDLPS